MRHRARLPLLVLLLSAFFATTSVASAQQPEVSSRAQKSEAASGKALGAVDATTGASPRGKGMGGDSDRLPALPLRPEMLGGIPVVVLAGTHYERGVSHGKALAKQIIDVVDNYLAPQTNPMLFFMTIKSMREQLKVDPGIEEEAKGVVAGAKEALGGKFRSRYMSDDFTWQDIIGFSTYIDYVGTNCSSVSAWGAATVDSALNAQAVLARNLDWSNDPVLLRNQALFVHLPSEAGEQPFLSVGFAGFLGCLSCINQQRLGAFLNLGYGSRSGKFPPDEAYTPSALAFRHAIEVRRDKDLLDAFVADMTGSASVGSYIIHVAGPPAATKQDPALVLELSAGRHAVRHASDDERFGNEILVATNHHRKLEKPSSCRRYETAVDTLAGSDKTTDPEALLALMVKMSRPDTMETMLFIPSTGEFRLAAKTKGDGEVGTPEKTSLDVLFGK